MSYKSNVPSVSVPLKQTRNGKAMAPVVDIFPQLCQGFHDRQRIREEMRLLRELGFDRVYLVLCNAGYPQFSKPQTALQLPAPEVANHALESILALGDPNWAYLDECRRQGMEAWGIFKPYEGGGGITVPHGAGVPLSRTQTETVGGERVQFDELLSRRPDLRLARRPAPQTEMRQDQPVTAVELAFCLAPFRDRRGHNRHVDFAGLDDDEAPTPDATLWTSADNGRYVPFEGAFRYSRRIEPRRILDANGYPVADEARRCLVLTLDRLHLPPRARYLAVTLSDWESLYTIPFSMIRAFGPHGEIPVTVGCNVRSSVHPCEAARPPELRNWSFAGDLRTGTAAEKNFHDWGFEFEWHGAGFWGDGWRQSPVYGIGRGKLPYMKGTPCEAYDEVRESWLETVRQAAAMGYDGVDIRLQNHSGMVSDYANYGWNEPIARRYREKHGVDMNRESADPLEVMRVRGEFFERFLEQAAGCLHNAGSKLQVHLRHCHQEPHLRSDFNELGFWAMPRVLLDWRNAVDLADEITIKDYFHNHYRPEAAGRIKRYANKTGKRVWVHCYIAQGRELNDEYLDAVEADPTVDGILFYEVAHAREGPYESNFGLIEQVGPPAYYAPNADILRKNLARRSYG